MLIGPPDDERGLEGRLGAGVLDALARSFGDRVDHQQIAAGAALERLRAEPLDVLHGRVVIADVLHDVDDHALVDERLSVAIGLAHDADAVVADVLAEGADDLDLERRLAARQDQSRELDQREDHEAGEPDHEQAAEAAVELERLLPAEVAGDVDERHRVGHVPQVEREGDVEDAVVRGRGADADETALVEERGEAREATAAKPASAVARRAGPKRPNRSSDSPRRRRSTR